MTPFFSAQVRWRESAQLLGSGLLVLTWLGYLGRWFWFFALFDHFRLQLSVGCVLVLILSIITGRRRMIAIAACGLGANLWPIAQTTWVAAPAAKTVADWQMKVICFNVLTSNTDKAGVIDYLRAQDADLVILIEVNQEWVTAMGALHPKYPFRIEFPRSDNFGMMCLSKADFVEQEVVDMGDATPALFASVVHQGRRLQCIGVHPLPPTNAESAESGRHYIEGVGRWVKDRPPGATLVTGDFNSAPWGRSMRDLIAVSGLDYRQSTAAWWPTWLPRTIFMLPLDLSLCTAPLVIDRRIGPDLGSDHRPQELRLLMQVQAP